MIHVTVRNGEAIRVQVGEHTASAAYQAGLAADAAEATAADVILVDSIRDMLVAAGRYFSTRAAGEAGSTAGQLFAAPVGGVLKFFEKTSGGSFEIDPPSGLASLDRAKLAAIDISRVTAILSDAGGAAPYAYHPDVPVASHQERGRKSRFVAPAIGSSGAWVDTDGRIRAARFGFSPWNSGGVNAARWAEWRDDIQDMQTRQEGRNLTSVFDAGYTYSFDDTCEVRNSNIHVDFEYSTADFGGGPIGFTFEPNVSGSSNLSGNLMHDTGLHRVHIANVGESGVRVANAPRIVLDTVKVVGGSSAAFFLQGGVSPKLRNLIAYGAQLGVLIETGIREGIAGPLLLTAFDVEIRGLDIQGCSSGAVSIREAMGVRIYDPVLQVNGGSSGRSLDVARCLSVKVDGLYDELNQFSLVLDDQKRVQQTYAWTGSTTAGSGTITNLSFNPNGKVWLGMPITGAGMPVGAVVRRVLSTSSIEIGVNPYLPDGRPTPATATATGAGVALSLGYDAAYGNYSIVDPSFAGDSTGAGTPYSLTVLGDHQNIRLRGGRYSGQVSFSTTGSTGWIDPGTEFAGTPTFPRGFNRYTGGLRPDVADGSYATSLPGATGGTTVDTQSRASIAALIAAAQSAQADVNALKAVLRAKGLMG